MSAGKLIPEITLLVQAKESLADGELRGSKGAFPVFGILFQKFPSKSSKWNGRSLVCSSPGQRPSALVDDRNFPICTRLEKNAGKFFFGTI